jgi:excisionase family DNA binding protein
MMPPKQPPQLDTIEDLARYLQIAVVTVRMWVKKGYIPEKTYIKVGNTYRFDRGAVMQALRHPELRLTLADTPMLLGAPKQLDLFKDA